jgi:hypothetical protein
MPVLMSRYGSRSSVGARDRRERARIAGRDVVRPGSECGRDTWKGGMRRLMPRGGWSWGCMDPEVGEAPRAWRRQSQACRRRAGGALERGRDWLPAGQPYIDRAFLQN